MGTKKIMIVLVLSIELLALGIYYGRLSAKEYTDYFVAGNELDAQYGDGEAFLQFQTSGVMLEQGIYDITVQYTASGGGTVEVFGDIRNSRSIWSDTIRYIPEKKGVTFSIWVNEKTKGVGVAIRPDGGEILVDYVKIGRAWNSGLYLTLVLALKLLLLDGGVLLLLYGGRLRNYSVQIWGIAGITLICSVGLFGRYLTYGHDMVFHLNRIEGLKDGLLSGMFPVRVQPTWNNGWGYAVSVMYGDLTLWLPALMRMAGFTLQTTWKTFLITVNLLTAVISYYSFYKIGRDKYAALAASLLYCTGMYRLACIYVRAAVGEFTVIMFLPLVVLGFWYAFDGEEMEERYGEKLAAPVIGFTGMIQTHVLTCEMSALFLIALCLIMIKKVMRKETFFYLLKIAVWTILINLWFLVPFFCFWKEGLVVSQMTEMRDDFQTWGLSFAEIFATSPSKAYNFTFGENVSLANKCTFSLGTALFGGAAACLIFLWNDKVKKPKAAAVSLSFGGAAVWMASNLFPYQRIKESAPKVAAALSKIQFPYRFLGLAGLFFTLAVFFTAIRAKGIRARRYLAAGLIALSTLAAYQGMDYQYQILYGGAFENKYSPAVLNTADVVSGEYLYENSSVDVKDTLKEVTGSGVVIDFFYGKYLDTVVSCKAAENGAYIEVPVFYYPGYVAVDKEGGRYRVLKSENNNRVRVELPKGFDGVVRVSYEEPYLFRVCLAISLLSSAAFLFRGRIKQGILAKKAGKVWRKNE